MSEQAPIDDFAAAKAVYDQLRVLPKDRQERVLRWVGESLGIAPTARIAASAPASPPLGLAHPPASSSAMTGAQPEHRQLSGAAPDIRTFVAQKVPASDNQFAAVVAYYYRFVAPESERREAIGGAVLQEAARLAGRRRLSNPRQTLANARNMGYLDSQGRGEFTINSVGENLVALAMPASGEGSAGGTSGTNGVKSARRKRPKKAPQAKKSSTPARKSKR